MFAYLFLFLENSILKIYARLYLDALICINLLLRNQHGAVVLLVGKTSTMFVLDENRNFVQIFIENHQFEIREIGTDLHFEKSKFN